jgi:formate/nitrite transporter FocA (FNT family)
MKMALAAAFFLTILTWIFFDLAIQNAKLGPQATSVVFGFWFGLGLIIRWLYGRFVPRKSRGQGE